MWGVELIGTLLTVHGSAAQREAYLADVSRCACAHCITEVEAGTDVSGIKTTAVRDGADGGFQAPRGPDLQCADRRCGLRRHAPTGRRPHRGMSIFIVDLAEGRRAARRNTRWASVHRRWAPCTAWHFPGTRCWTPKPRCPYHDERSGTRTIGIGALAVDTSCAGGSRGGLDSTCRQFGRAICRQFQACSG